MKNMPMRLLKVEGDMVSIYEGRKRLAVYAGASQLTVESSEQLRLATQEAIDADPVPEKSDGDAA
jgi:DNA/RNA endonuclease YhcR with UshA esterase domain